ncbi:MAG: methyltransferase [Planctomycetota bacterium]|nr:MAG: methyltransferase [Planctomycetota bacterium]
MRELASAGQSVRWLGDLALCDGPPRALAWPAEIFADAEAVSIASIGDAARQLRARQRNWVHLSLEHHRRGELIAEKLPHFRAKAFRFGDSVPDAPLGHFGLLDANTLLVLPRGRSGVARGEFLFEENHDGPPSRAYLKLWEAFTRIGLRPAPGETCVDLGGSPGGWSWVLLQLGARVIAVDKAPLDDALCAHERLTVLQQSAFAPLPTECERADWLLSDVICYPERLLRLIEERLARPDPPSIVATIKFQGEAQPEIAERFAAIPGARVVHLSHNKHELTFVRLRDTLGVTPSHL